MNNLIFHHLGLAVKELLPAKMFLETIGYIFLEPIFDPLQNVNLVMTFHSTMPAVEVIYPKDNNSPISKMLDTHSNGLIYHMCYYTNNLQEALKELKQNNIVFCVSEPKPAILFGGKKVSFYMIKGVGLIEILELDTFC